MTNNNLTHENEFLAEEIQVATFSITGTLENGITRVTAKKIIEESGNHFSEGVTRKTDYLVVKTLGTAKAEKAARTGVEIITESELWDLLELDEVPISLKIHPKRAFPKIPWVRIENADKKRMHICYHDEYGVVTDRDVLVIAHGQLISKVGSVRKYIQIIDQGDDKVKTFRCDRIISAESV